MLTWLIRVLGNIHVVLLGYVIQQNPYITLLTVHFLWIREGIKGIG